jgi:hypothetical protein
MKDLEGSWYKFGIGSDGAKAALVAFQVEYDRMLSHKDVAGASGLLHGTLEDAQKTLDVMHELEQVKAKQASGHGQNSDIENAQKAVDFLREKNLISGVTGTFTKAELDSQVMLVAALKDQVNNEKEIAAVKKQDSGNEVHSEGNRAAAQAATGARQAAESKMRLSEMALAVDKSSAEAALTISRATLEERLTADIDFANRDRDIKLAANAAEMSALDKSGKDYQNQLKALQEKNIEIQQEAVTKISELKSKASVEENARDLRDLEQSIREKIENTGSGEAERLAVIEAAIRVEQAKRLEDTNFYRELMKQRVQITRQMSEEEAKQREEAGKEEADAELKSGELVLAAHRQMIALEESTRHQSIARQMSDEVQNADLEYNLKMAAYQKEAAAVDKNAKDRENKLKAIQDKETQLTQQHENDLTNIKANAEIARNQQVLSSFSQFQGAIASGLTQSIMGHETWAKMLTQLGDQVVTGMLQNAIKSMLMEDMDKERTAAKAARKGYVAGMEFPFPANLVMAPVLAAGAFAAVMAFEGGTDSVGGVGRGDVIPAMLTPGEGVVPGGVMDGLRTMARDGGMSQRPMSSLFRRGPLRSLDLAHLGSGIVHHFSALGLSGFERY